MASNIANRNISLILAISSLAGLIYCVIATVKEGGKWTSLCPIIVAAALFLRFYLCYRKEVKKGNIYGKVDPFRLRQYR